MGTPDRAEEQFHAAGAVTRAPKALGAHALRDAAPEDERMEDEEKILAGRSDVNMPALLTRDVHGG